LGPSRNILKKEISRYNHNMSHPRYPRSAYEKTHGLVYFARMIDKIRLHHAGDLPKAYFPYLGEGFDGRCCRFLAIDYDALQERVLKGGSNEDILNWCFETGRHPTEEQIAIWNAFATKRGWRDEIDGGTEILEKHKAEADLKHRTDIVTFFDFYDVDEKRRP
jgi:gluconokinase